MITGSDQLTAQERAQTTDCFVELALAWLQRPLGGLTDTERTEALSQMCLLISQMRHKDPQFMEIERRRWIERVTVRLCAGVPGGQERAPGLARELEEFTTVVMLRYHDWREKHALPLSQRSAS